MEHVCRSNSETLTEGSLSDKIGKSNSKQVEGFKEEELSISIDFGVEP